MGEGESRSLGEKFKRLELLGTGTAQPESLENLASVGQDTCV